jgi:hypothetical protein
MSVPVRVFFSVPNTGVRGGGGGWRKQRNPVCLREPGSWNHGAVSLSLVRQVFTTEQHWIGEKKDAIK